MEKKQLDYKKIAHDQSNLSNQYFVKYLEFVNLCTRFGCPADASGKERLDWLESKLSEVNGHDH